MSSWRKEFKEFRTTILRLLWRQWTALGVSGQVDQSASSMIDPEALLLFSLSVARFDARLFDEIADWLFINGEFVNVQRLTGILGRFKFRSGPQLSSLAAYLAKNSEYRLKWRRLANAYTAGKDETLFFSPEGKTLPVGEKKDEIFLARGLLRPPLSMRGRSLPFPVGKPPTFLLRLRALIGITSRCEMLCLLAGGSEIHPAEAARRTAYSRKTAQNALREMARSGMVECRETGREKTYRMTKDELASLIPPQIRWISWAALYRGIEILWYGAESDSEDALLFSADLRRCALEARPLFSEAQTGIVMTNPARTPGVEYIEVFKQDLVEIRRGYEKLI